jgi:F0F1-type ATP synthase assembly protein I
MFGDCSVWALQSLAKNFTSTRFLAVDTTPEQPKDSHGNPRKPLSSGSEFAGLGIQMGAVIGCGAWLGYWLDGKLGTLPWLTILLVFVGAGAAFYSMYRRVIGGRK